MDHTDVLELMEQFEYPLPILKTSLDQLTVEAPIGGAIGNFTLENTGGSVLSGTLLSNSACVYFPAPKFSGNKVSVIYHIRLQGYRPGDFIQTSVVIMSNGGERTLPVFIKVVPAAVESDDGTKISTLKDFLRFAEKEPNQAHRLFASGAFPVWLLSLGFEYVDIYRQLNADPNKERALENFFILCGLKERPALQSAQGPLHFRILPNVAEMLSGQFEVERSGWGSVDAEVGQAGNKPWLEVVPKRLTNASFGETNKAAVIYKINTGLLEGAFDDDVVLVGDRIRVPVRVRKEKLIDAKLSKEAFLFGDTGTVVIHNNSGRDVAVELDTKDSFIKLAQRRLVCGAAALAEFHLKSSPFVAAQMALLGRPEVTGGIVVTVRMGETSLQKTLALTVGESFMVK